MVKIDYPLTMTDGCMIIHALTRFQATIAQLDVA
jgi:hypothetical protein